MNSLFHEGRPCGNVTGFGNFINRQSTDAVRMDGTLKSEEHTENIYKYGISGKEDFCVNTIYQCPDGVIRWTGETPGRAAGLFSFLEKVVMIGFPALCILTLIIDEFYDAFGTISTFVFLTAFWRVVLFILRNVFGGSGKCMFYELDSTGLTMHEMKGKASDLNNLLNRFSKGDTVRFPAAKQTTRLPRAVLSSAVLGKNGHTVVVNENTELYTLGSAADLLAVLTGAPVPSQPSPLRAVPPSVKQPAAGIPRTSTPARMAMRSMNTAAELMSQTVKVQAPKKAGTLRIQLPEHNARILGKSIQSLGGLR